MKLLPSEEFVGHIHDESGIKLFFLYNHDTNAFYDVLDDEFGTTDNFAELGENVLIGKRTGFIYYFDREFDRKILVAVNNRNASANNFLDGPGDQVPFRLNFKDKLNATYPNTYLFGGINPHGVYLDTNEWTRIAVAPFEITDNAQSAIDRVDKCDSISEKSVFWTCLTKEWWNTPEWRQSVYDKLRDEEGKNVTCTSLGVCKVS